MADAVPTAAVTINDGDGYINNTEKSAVGYTIAGLDADATATVTFTSSGGGAPVLVSGLVNGTTSVNLLGLSDGTITATIAIATQPATRRPERATPAPRTRRRTPSRRQR